MSTTVSVVIPCFRYGHFVEACVDSVLAQESAALHVDVLVIDDASPDDSWDVVRRLPARSPRVSVERHATNRGLVPTVNEGLARATGEYVVVLSADDLLTPGALHRATSALAQHPDASFAYGPVQHLTPRGTIASRAGRPAARRVPGTGFLRSCASTGGNPIWSPEVVARTTAQREVGDYNPRLRHTSDLEMWLRLASVGAVVRLTGPPQAVYRHHGANMSRGQDVGDLANLRSLLDAFQSWYDVAGRRLPEGAELLRRAEHRLARQALRAAGRALDRRDVEQVGPLLHLALTTDPTARRSVGHALVGLKRRSGPWRPPLVLLPPYRRVRDAVRQARRLPPLTARPRRPLEDDGGGDDRGAGPARASTRAGQVD